MKIRQFVWEIVDSNSWLITEDNRGLLIDAVINEQLSIELSKLESLTIILTHSHFDHICGLNNVRVLVPNTVLCATRQCSYNIGNMYRNMSASANAFMAFYNNKPFSGNIEPIVCMPADITFENSFLLNWENHEIMLEAFHGHSNDSLVATVDGKYLFSGDSILSVPTVTRFPGGSTARFWDEDMPKLKNMSVEKVFPGHGLPGKLEDMIAVNDSPKKTYR